MSVWVALAFAFGKRRRHCDRDPVAVTLGLPFLDERPRRDCDCDCDCDRDCDRALVWVPFLLPFGKAKKTLRL